MKRMKRFWILLCLACLVFGGAAAEGFADFSEKFADKFSADGAVWTENGYQSENIALEITTLRQNDTDIYVADFYVRSPAYLQRAFGSDKWGRSSVKIATMAQQNNAVIALTGDNGHLLKAGIVAGNGEVFRQRGNNVRDLCVIYTDGTMQTHYAKVDNDLVLQQAAEGLVWQAFVFGPALLDENGKAIPAFPHSDVNSENPRAVIGYFEPGHYCLVQIDGRGTDSALEEKKHNKGLTLVQTAELMESLGCATAYNLDGGQSALMWYRDGILSTPYHGGRSVGDIIILCEEPGIAPARQETVQEAPAEETDVAEATVQPTATPAPAEEEWNWEDYEVLE